VSDVRASHPPSDSFGAAGSEAATDLRSPAKSENVSVVAFDLKDIIAARLGENYQLHERHLNRTLVAAQRVIGFDKVYARAEGAYLYDMDNQPYLDFLSGYSVFNIGSTWICRTWCKWIARC